MPYLVLDTNVLVSALIRSAGPPGRILDTVLAGSIQLAFDDRILAEYRTVLHRPKFGFAPQDVDTLLNYLERSGLPVSALPLPVRLPDPNDLPFVEVAVAAQARALITGNLRHFPAPVLQGLSLAVLSPAHWLAQYADPTR